MFYCSKCAINLLQQGFRVEELKKDLRIKVHQNTANTNTEYSDSYEVEGRGRQDQHLSRGQDLHLTRGQDLQVSRGQDLQGFSDKIDQAEQSLNQYLGELESECELDESIQENIESIKRLFENIALNLSKICEKEVGDLEQLRSKNLYLSLIHI